MDKWAGEIDWSLETFPVSVGTYEFKWLVLFGMQISLLQT